MEGFDALGPGLARHARLRGRGLVAHREGPRTHRRSRVPPGKEEPLTDPAALAALAALGLAGLQLVLARWRDLGPATTAASGASVVLGLPRPDPEGLVAVAVAMAVAAAAWARGGARGVGRPGLDGLVVAAAVAGGTAIAWLPATVPLGPARAAVAAGLGLLGALATALAIERPRAGRPPVRWVGELRVGP